MHALTLEAQSQLKIIATRLPTVLEMTVEYHFVPLEEAQEMYPDQRDIKAIPKGPLKGLVRVPMPVQIAATHYRRLKKRYISGGEPSVIEYIRYIKGLKSDC